MATGKTLLNIADRYDRELAKVEKQAMARIAAAYDVSYRQLIADLREAYGRLEQAGSISALVRKGAILQELAEALEFIDPTRPGQYQAIAEELLQQSVTLGEGLASDTLKTLGAPSRTFTTVPVGAVRFQAETFARRLVNYSTQQASQISAVVEQGLIQGWGVRKVEAQLKGLGVSFKSNAESVARTEQMSAYNGAALNRYEQGGVKYIQWIALPSERVCFPGDVLIRTSTGDVPISNVKVGDFVLTRYGFKRVAKVHERQYSGKFTRISAGSLSVIATANHPFWTTRGWLSAEHVKNGDTIQTFHKELVNVTSADDIGFWQAEKRPSCVIKSLSLSSIPFGVLMPKGSVSLNSKLNRGKSKVNRIPSKPKFLNKVKVHPFKGFPNDFFKGCFSREFAVTRPRTKPTSFEFGRNDTFKLSAAIASKSVGRAITFFRTIFSMLLFRRQHHLLATALTGFGDTHCTEPSVPALHATADDLKPCFTHVKEFAANGTGFLRSLPLRALPLLLTSSIAKLSIFVSGNSLKAFLAPFAGFDLNSRRLMTQVAFLRTILGSLVRVSGKKGIAPCTIDISGSHELCDVEDQHTHSTTFNHSTTVYNLSVEDVPEYYANGILVHNCGICASRNGNIYKAKEFPQIPAHVRCRCSSAPVLSADDIDTSFYEQYRAEGIAELKAQGLKPDGGLTYWEKKAGLTEAPKPVWTPGKPLPKLEAMDPLPSPLEV